MPTDDGLNLLTDDYSNEYGQEEESSDLKTRELAKKEKSLKGLKKLKRMSREECARRFDEDSLNTFHHIFDCQDIEEKKVHLARSDTRHFIVK